MGRWGFGTFDSDDAAEWADGLSGSGEPLAILEDAIPENHLDLDDFNVEFVLCAAEALIAILAPQSRVSRVHFDDAAFHEADAVRLKPHCVSLLRRLLAQDIGFNTLWFDNPDNPLKEWESEVQRLLDDLENA